MSCNIPGRNKVHKGCRTPIGLATQSEAGLESAADKTKLDGLTAGISNIVSGVVAEQMGGLPASLALSGALAGMKVVQVLGTSTGNVTDQRAEFESVISADGFIKQTGGPSGTGLVSILLTQS